MIHVPDSYGFEALSSTLKSYLIKIEFKNHKWKT